MRVQRQLCSVFMRALLIEQLPRNTCTRLMWPVSLQSMYMHSSSFHAFCQFIHSSDTRCPYVTSAHQQCNKLCASVVVCRENRGYSTFEHFLADLKQSKRKSIRQVRGWHCEQETHCQEATGSYIFLCETTWRCLGL